MASSKGLTDIVGYEFYQITFTSAICFSVYVFFGYFLVLAGACAMCYLLHLAYAYQTSSPVDPKGRGIGFAFAQHLDELGFTVFASCLDDKSHGARKLRTTCSKKLHVLHCDVTKDDSINNAAEYIRKRNITRCIHFISCRAGLWAVINNAGINMISEIELTTPSMYNRGLDVNLYGPIRVIKAFLPWNNYEVAKHGMETLSDSLRLEMAKFGVRVSIVEPGAFAHATAIHTDAMVGGYTRDIQ
ncbi:BDH-like protein [Mya arenaria]|uniref:BDH-like protein n=1 Tax=Mya arenaria TaxID=6604 RepID=A0ABY7FF36_MYAAR|nr:BDH-like protein [Mya arenaria]